MFERSDVRRVRPSTIYDFSIIRKCRLCVMHVNRHGHLNEYMHGACMQCIPNFRSTPSKMNKLWSNWFESLLRCRLGCVLACVRIMWLKVASAQCNWYIYIYRYVICVRTTRASRTRKIMCGSYFSTTWNKSVYRFRIPNELIMSLETEVVCVLYGNQKQCSISFLLLCSG